MNNTLLDTETAVIGGILIDPQTCAFAFDMLAPQDFESEAAKKVFERLKAMCAAGKVIDGATVMSELAEKPLQQFALTCMESVPSLANFPAYVDVVRKESIKRRMLDKLQEITYTAPEPDDIVRQLSAIIELGDVKEPETMSDWLMQYNADIYNPLDTSSRLYTGFSRLDSVIGGLRKGSLSYIGAAPSTGKTTFAQNIARRIEASGHRVLFFSLEMSRGQIMDKRMADECGIDFKAVDEHKASDEEKHRMSQVVGEVFERKLLEIVDDEYFLENIVAKIIRNKPEMVFVDFLQNIRTKERFPTRKNQVDYISAEFKRVARLYDCHICVMSQINRLGEQGAPRMSDLKESGNLEADGDVIMLMYRPYVQKKTDEHSPTETHILLDKNKFGACGAIDFHFEPRFQRFTEIESRYGE